MVTSRRRDVWLRVSLDHQFFVGYVIELAVLGEVRFEVEEASR
jgi:hypothetical protein